MRKEAELSQSQPESPEAQPRNRGLTPERIARLRCSACGERMLARVRRPYEREISHDGRPPVKIVIPDLELVACTNPACDPANPDHTQLLDDEIIWRITAETYRQLGLLTPAEIRENRERLNLTQQQLADLLGLGGNSLSRWENGREYQKRSMDTLLRIVFGVPEAMRFARELHKHNERQSPAADAPPKELTAARTASAD